MSSLEMRMRFVKGSTMFNVAGGQEKGASDIVIKNSKIAGRFCKAQNRAMTHRGFVF